jgi:DNA-binding transcriptional MerR regulator
VTEPVVEIPNRPAFRASEVCEIAQIPAYVLKSWEKEFPGLGTMAKPGGSRVYRRADVEQVMKIKHLLFAEGLTLAGARRKLEGEPKPEEDAPPDLPVAGEVRDKVARLKRELRSLLDLLSSPGSVERARPEAEIAVGSWPPVSAARADGVGESREEKREGEAADTRADAAADMPADLTPDTPADVPPDMPADPELPLLAGVPDDAPPAKRRRTSRRPHAPRAGSH